MRSNAMSQMHIFDRFIPIVRLKAIDWRWFEWVEQSFSVEIQMDSGKRMVFIAWGTY